MQARARDLLDARQRLDVHAPELGEVDVRHCRPRDPACAAALHDLFDERFDVVGGDAPFRAGAAHATEIDAELASELANRRASMSFGERSR